MILNAFSIGTLVAFALVLSGCSSAPVEPFEPYEHMTCVQWNVRYHGSKEYRFCTDYRPTKDTIAPGGFDSPSDE